MTEQEIEALKTILEALTKHPEAVVRHATENALTAIRQLQQPWQGIESAPKKGLIDIWTVGYGAEPMRYSECYYDSICGQWRTSRPLGQLVCIPERFVTAWMPIPPEPG